MEDFAHKILVLHSNLRNKMCHHLFGVLSDTNSGRRSKHCSSGWVWEGQYPTCNLFHRPVTWAKHTADASSAPVLIAYLRRFHSKATIDRKSTRLNSSHLGISYAVFCL